MQNQSNNPINETGCCPKFNPKPWQGKEIIWDNKIFVKDRVASFLHIPLNMGSKIVKNMKLIEAARAKPAEQLMLCDENSLWGSDIYINVSKEVPGVQMATLSGTFLTKVFPWKETFRLEPNFTMPSLRAKRV